MNNTGHIVSIVLDVVLKLLNNVIKLLKVLPVKHESVGRSYNCYKLDKDVQHARLKTPIDVNLKKKKCRLEQIRTALKRLIWA